MTGETPDPWPEHTKLLAVNDLTQGITNFLEWCEEKGYHLADSMDNEQVPVGSPLYDSLLSSHFGIDLVKIEAEKRAMIAELRKGMS